VAKKSGRATTRGRAAPPRGRARPTPGRLSRLIRQPAGKVLAGVGAVVLASAVAFGTGVANRGVDRLFPSKAASPSVPAPLPFPIEVALSTGFDDGMSYALPAPVLGGPDAAPLLTGFAGDEELAAYLHARGGAPLEAMVPFFTFTGLAPTGSVRITDLRVHAKQAAPVLSGSRIDTSSEGERDTVPVTVDLDQPSLEVIDQAGKPYFRGHDLELVANEHVKVVITFSAAKRCYHWVMAVDYVLPTGTRQTAYVDNAGKLHKTAAEIAPEGRFSLTGPAAGYRAVWDTNSPLPGFSLTS
jgi:hypothetical protein